MRKLVKEICDRDRSLRPQKPNSQFGPPPPAISDDTKKSDGAEPDIDRIDIGKSKKGTIAEGQRKEYKFRGGRNVALRFTLQRESFSRLTGRYAAEIYDDRGRQLKREMVYPNKGKEIVFTPLVDGWYILRLTGESGYGNYTVYLDGQ